MNLDKLLPCPFCGKKDLILVEDKAEDDNNRVYAYHIYCRDCCSHGGNNYPISWCENEQMAIERWNERSLQDNNIQDFISESQVHYFGELIGRTAVNGEIVNEKLVYHLRPGDIIRVYRKRDVRND